MRESTVKGVRKDWTLAESWAGGHERRAKKDRICRVCHKGIPAGTKYLAEKNECCSAHLECIKTPGKEST